jgi:hypothetical protein
MQYREIHMSPPRKPHESTKLAFEKNKKEYISKKHTLLYTYFAARITGKYLNL